MRCLPLMLLLAGCYTYRPLPTTEPAPGTRVSVQLTTDGSRELSAAIGPEILHVEGDVLQVDSSGLALSVQQVENYRGFRSDWNGERVAVPRSSIAGLQERRLSVGGTGLLAGLGVVGLYAIYRALGGGNLFEGNGGSGGTGGEH